MFCPHRYITSCFLTVFCLWAAGQRVYKPHSVLAAGQWYKIEVAADGVYKIDRPFLAALGVNGSIPSTAVRIYGNSGGMLPEANNRPRIDDLEELALQVEDGGDGLLNGSDYLLFYATGPDKWLKDSVNRRFTHQRNLYSNKAYYYITVGGTGKRIADQPGFTPPGAAVTTYDERLYHELDTVNLLASGKEWYGEEFSDAPGHTVSYTFPLPISDAVVGQPATLVSSVAARSVNSGSKFVASTNNQVVQQLTVPPVNAVYLDLFGRQVTEAATFTLTQNNPALTYNFVPGSFNAQGWLNWYEVFYRRQLAHIPNQQLAFRDWSSVGNGTATFSIANADASMQVWDVTDPFTPVKMNAAITGNQLTFSNEAKTLHEYIGFSTTFLTPQPVGAVANQDLHYTTPVDYIIITYPLFLPQAQQLAQYHQQQDHLRTLVVTTDQVYNEFSGGLPDPTALRDFVKMYYDRYRSIWPQSPKYLLLFGAASYDYKDRLPNNTNFVPAWESVNSLDPLSTYTTDDFFGFLDDDEDINSGLVKNDLDMAIGRLPAQNEAEAKNFLDKLQAYGRAASFGPWRNTLTFVADDGDNNLHLQDAETITATAQAAAPVFNQQKIYLDAFKKEGGSAGGQYPQVKEAINNAIYSGTLIWNYSGHGGPNRLADEGILDLQMVNSWSNADKLPLFITASCDFAPYDHPGINSLGENLLLRPKTGAIALMATARPVFAYSNRIINNNYLQAALRRDSSGQYPSLGAALQAAKNYTYNTSGDIINNSKFALLGDPALTLAFPRLKVVATAVNGRDMATATDTLRATEYATISGVVMNYSGRVLDDFKGTVSLTLFDKLQTLTTLGNDATSSPVPFPSQTNVLFKGRVSATGGRFSVQFRMPRDINYQYGPGKISLYAQGDSTDGNGYSTKVMIGGISASALTDKEGPVIKAYLNDDKFVNGSVTNQTPVLLLKLADSSGINTAGTGIGHDLVAILDGDNKQYFVLNNFFESDLNSYQSGSLRFQLPTLPPGPHTLAIKAWDVVNNSSTYQLSFTVINTEELKIDHVLNYPNPFTTRTAFWFEHNQPLTDLQVTVQVFTVSGKLIKTLHQTINTTGFRSNEVEWDGRDDYGQKVGRGVYIYRLAVQAPNGKKAHKLERLVIL